VIGNFVGLIFLKRNGRKVLGCICLNSYDDFEGLGFLWLTVKLISNDHHYC